MIKFVNTITYLAVLFITLFITLQRDCFAATDEIIVPYQSSDYKYQIYPLAAVPTAFGALDFDDADFQTGKAGFGSGGWCAISSTVNTMWPLNSEIVLRKHFIMPSGASNLRVFVAVDNDVQILINGVDISNGLVTHEGCPNADDFSFQVPDNLLQAGDNLIAVRARDRCDVSFIDIQLVVAADVINYSVPYLSQLNYEHWGQSACGPTSIAMLLRYWYPNSQIDVPEVYHAATQANGYYSSKTSLIGAPLPGYFNVGWQTTRVWSGTTPDTGLDRVPNEFDAYHQGTYSGMVINNAITYLKKIWGASAQVKTGQTITNVLDELHSGPVILNVNEGYGGHYIVLRGYDESSQTFYINDPYPPYQDPDKTSPFPDAVNVPVTYAKLSRWFKGTMITFQPPASHTALVRQNTVVVDNGIANWGDTGNLNSNCEGSTHCFQIDDINAKTGGGNYVWKSYHANGKDWIYPVEDGHWVKWTPKLPVYGKYLLMARFYDSCNSDIHFDIHASTGRLLSSRTITHTTTGYRSVSLGPYRLKDGAYAVVEKMPTKCNADAVMFRYVGN